MNMLTPNQLELIHGEVDGENTPEASAEVRKLVETQPEALALMKSLRALDGLFREVPERVPSARVTQLIHNAMPLNSRASPRVVQEQGATQSITGWAIKQWNGVTNLMGELMQTKKVLIGATTLVAVIAIIGYATGNYPPGVRDAGTIGAKDGMGGVQQAGRYKGRTMTEADVTLSNPEISVLFQNDQILKLVKSDAFHELMSSAAFHELQSNEAFHELMSSEAFHELMSSEAFHELMKDDAFHDLMKDDAFQNLAKDDAFQNLAKNDAFQNLAKDDAFHDLMKGDAFHDLLKDDAFQNLAKNDLFMSVMSNDVFMSVMSNEAFHQLQSSDMFRTLSREQSLSDAFMNQALHAEQ